MFFQVILNFNLGIFKNLKVENWPSVGIFKVNILSINMERSFFIDLSSCLRGLTQKKF